jgi:hypothetical protein
VIQRAGVEPDARRAEPERFLGRAREQRAPQSAADERRGQAKVRDLHRGILAGHELEVAGDFVLDAEHPDADLRLGQMGRQLLVAPRVASCQ